MITVVRHDHPAAFLSRAQPWLLQREDRYNLMLGLAYGRSVAGEWPDDSLFATVERDDEIVGCVMRTPPHKALLTELPLEAAPVVATALAESYDRLPAVLGPPAMAEAVASAWVVLRGGGWRPGMEQGIYRLDRVTAPDGVAGGMRVATVEDTELGTRWAEGFARDTGVAVGPERRTVERWIEAGTLHVWEVDGAPTSLAVAHGRTLSGVRIGYVYTPPEHRKRGYASACVAALSQKMLDGGFDFCILYTDLSNRTSNDIYRRLGYGLIAEVRDFDLIPSEDLE